MDNPILTPAETDVLRQVALGATTRKIAEARGCSLQTAKNQRHDGMHKLGIADTVRLTHFAIATGLVDLLYHADGSPAGKQVAA